MKVLLCLLALGAGLAAQEATPEAKEAAKAAALDQAKEAARAAVERVEKIEEPYLRFETAKALGDVLLMSGDREAAREQATRTLRAAEPIDDPLWRLRSLARSAALLHATDERGLAEGVMRRAIDDARLIDDAEIRASMLARLAGFQYEIDEAASKALLEEAVEIALDVEDFDLRITVLEDVTKVHGTFGEREKSNGDFERLAEAFRVLPDDEQTRDRTVDLIYAMGHADAYEIAVRFAAEAGPGRSVEAGLLFHLVGLIDEEDADAMAALEQVRPLLDEVDAWKRGWILCELASAYARLGTVDAALRAIEAFGGMNADVRSVNQTEYLRALAAIAPIEAKEGRTEAARGRLESVLEDAARLPDDRREVRAAVAKAQAEKGDLESARRTAAGIAAEPREGERPTADQLLDRLFQADALLRIGGFAAFLREPEGGRADVKEALRILPGEDAFRATIDDPEELEDAMFRWTQIQENLVYTCGYVGDLEHVVEYAPVTRDSLLADVAVMFAEFGYDGGEQVLATIEDGDQMAKAVERLGRVLGRTYLPGDAVAWAIAWDDVEWQMVALRGVVAGLTSSDPPGEPKVKDPRPAADAPAPPVRPG